MNRLADSTSPYLLLHKDNPVDWYPWGPEALALARAEDKPIFLSVGYSTCYWCHVMERESFTNDEIAELMNRHFVNIKLDREERPDLDEIYMSATQLITQRGGWPNSVFLTPELEPFYAGTYFPPEDRQGLPGFPRVLHSMAEAWRSRRAEVEEQAAGLVEAIRHSLEDRPEPADALPDGSAAERSLAGLERSFDPQWGGFGSAPKFPTPSNLFLLLEVAGEVPKAAEMLSTTVDRMARGGIYDHLGGGFHRYATDREWRIPHFEKMLYDNGWLLEAFGREFQRSPSARSESLIRKTAGFLARELTAPEGAFWSALDAETDGHEGAFYVWSREQLLDVLGDEDFGFLAPLLGFDGAPFFEGSFYVLHHPEPLGLQAKRRRLTRGELLEQMAPLEQKLFEARAVRKPLLVDDKILTDWNGAAIAGLATAGRAIGDATLVEQAAAAARFVASSMRSPDGELLHAWRNGRGEIPAFLADYAYFVRGVLALERAERALGSERSEDWLEVARNLTEEQVRRLGDSAGGFFAAAEAPDVLVRSKDFFDGAAPSANAVAVLNLLELAELTGEASWRREAERALMSFAPLLERLAEPARMMTIAARTADRSSPSKRASPGQGAGARVPSALEAEARDKVALNLKLEGDTGDGTIAFRLELAIEPGFHVSAPHPTGDAPDWVRPVTVVAEGLEMAEIRFPEGARLTAPTDDESEVGAPWVYEGKTVVSGRLKAPRPLGGGGLRVTLQACDATRCLPVVEHFLEVEPRG